MHRNSTIARLALGVAGLLALLQAVALTGLSGGPLATLREAAHDPLLAGGALGALLLLGAAARPRLERRGPFDGELATSAAALLLLLVLGRSATSLIGAMTPTSFSAAAYVLDARLGNPGFVLGRMLAHAPAAATVCAMAWAAVPLLAAAAVLRDHQDGRGRVTVWAIALAVGVVLASAALWPLAGPQAAFADGFPAAPPDLVAAYRAMIERPQFPRTALPSLDALLAAFAALRLRRAGRTMRAASWTAATLASLYLIGSGRDPACCVLAALAVAVALDALLYWNPSRAAAVAASAAALVPAGWIAQLASYYPSRTSTLAEASSGIGRVLALATAAGSLLLPFLLLRRVGEQRPIHPPPGRSPQDPLAAALAGVFFLSGAAGLFYEVIFSKSFALTFGSTATAATTVLATYMGGIALGSWIGGIVAARARRPVVGYTACELGIAAWCCGAPALLLRLRDAYAALASGSGHGTQVALQLLLGAAALLPPTLLMGMTLPLLTQALLGRSRGLGDSVGRLYAANTLGAALGALCAGYAALPLLGVGRTTFVAVVANVVAAVLGYALVARRSGAPGAPQPEVETAAAPPAPAVERTEALAALAILGIGGAVTFALETAQVHVLAVIAGNSAYAFSLMLFAFLLGLSAGSAAGRRWLASGRSAAAGLAASELMLGAMLLLSVYRWDGLPSYFAGFGGWRPTSTFGAREVVRFVVCLSTLLPPALCIGAAYPLAMECIGRAWPERRLRALGRASAVNTIGNVAGALVGGFFLLPRAGSLGTLQALAGTAAALGALPAIALPRRQRWAAGLGLCAVAALFAVQPPSLNWTRLASGANVYFASTAWGTVIDHAESLDGGLTTVNEGMSGSDPLRILLTNGKFQGNDVVGGEMVAQVGFALDPLLHTPQRGLALNIGFGTGTTARIVQEAGFARVDVVDLSDDILRLANRWFGRVNGGVLSRPGVRTEVADGRNFLLLSRDRYDLITMELASIWFAGAGSLYNREFYQLARARLAERGVFQQWVQLHHIAPADVVSILATVRAEFPRVWLYESGRQGVIVACEWDCRPTQETLERIGAARELQRTLAMLQLSAADLAKDLLLEPDELDSLLAWAEQKGAVRVSTDDNLLLEYSTPRGNARAEPVGHQTTKALLARFSARTRTVHR